MHFRYRKNWVEDIIWNMDSKDLEGKKALIIAVAQKEDKFPEFFPLRSGQIIRIEKEAEAINIFFELTEHWVDYYDTNREYDTIIKSFPNVPTINNDNKFLEGKFILFGNMEKIILSSTDIAWNSIIEKIGAKEPFKNGVFFRMTKMIDAHSQVEIAVAPMDDYDNLTRGYTLEGGKRYILEFAFNFGKEPPKNAENEFFKIECPDLIKIFPNMKRLGFRIDKLKCNLSGEKIFWSQYTYINTKIEKNIEGPFLEIPIKLNKSLEAYLFGLMILVGLLLISGVIQDYGPWNLCEQNFLIKLIGTFLSTVGTWLLTSYKR
jgi:hypothetical protein